MILKIKAYLALVFICLVWGTNFVTVKYLINYKIPLVEILVIRYCIAGLLILAFFIFIKKEKLPTFKQFKFLFMLSIIVFILSGLAVNIALKYISVGLVALISALYPLFVLIIMHFLKGVKISLKAVIGIFIGLIGISLLTYKDIQLEYSIHFWLGFGLAFLSMLSWSVSTIIIANYHTDLNKYYSLGWQMLISGILLLIWLFFSKETISLNYISFKALFSLGYLIFVCSILVYIAFIYCLQHLKIGIVSMFAYVTPLIAIWLAFIILNEPVTKDIILGSVITLIGVYIVNESPHV